MTVKTTPWGTKNMSFEIRSKIFPLLYLVLVVISTGCVGLQNSKDVKGEHVKIRMLTVEDIDNYGTSSPTKQFLEAFGGNAVEDFNNGWNALREKDWIKTEGRSPVLAPIAVGAISVLVGAAFDAVTQRLDVEAKSYESQFASSAAFDGFWEKLQSGEPLTTANEWRAKYVGFEIIRYTSRFPPIAQSIGENQGFGQGACRIVILFARSKSDSRLFLLHPFLYANRSAKAKVDGSGKTIAAKIDLAIDSTWISKDQQTVSERIASCQFDVGGYLIDDRRSLRVLTDPGTQAAGWFSGVPVSLKADGSSDGLGVFRITALVTERDESRARQRIEEVSRFIGSQKEKVVEHATDIVNDGDN